MQDQLGSQENALIQEVKQRLETISTNCIALALMLKPEAVQQDCRRIAGAADAIVSHFLSMVSDGPDVYSLISHKINGYSNQITLGLGTLQFFCFSDEQKRLLSLTNECSQSLMSLLGRFYDAYDPGKQQVNIGQPLAGVEADGRRPLDPGKLTT